MPNPNPPREQPFETYASSLAPPTRDRIRHLSGNPFNSDSGHTSTRNPHTQVGRRIHDTAASSDRPGGPRSLLYPARRFKFVLVVEKLLSVGRAVGRTTDKCVAGNTARRHCKEQVYPALRDAIRQDQMLESNDEAYRRRRDIRSSKRSHRGPPNRSIAATLAVCWMLDARCWIEGSIARRPGDHAHPGAEAALGAVLRVVLQRVAGQAAEGGGRGGARGGG
jgi:hypothetical protein